MADFIWENGASRCCEFTDGEDVHRFSDEPALKLGQQFTGTAAETTTPIFPVKRRQRRYFSSSTPSTPLILGLNAANAVVFPVERRYYFGWTPLTPLFFRLSAVNAAIFPVKRR